MRLEPLGCLRFGQSALLVGRESGDDPLGRIGFHHVSRKGMALHNETHYGTGGRQVSGFFRKAPTLPMAKAGGPALDTTIRNAFR